MPLNEEDGRQEIDKRLCKVKSKAWLQEIVFETISIGARVAYERQYLGWEDR